MNSNVSTGNSKIPLGMELNQAIDLRNLGPETRRMLRMQFKEFLHYLDETPAFIIAHEESSMALNRNCSRPAA